MADSARSPSIRLLPEDAVDRLRNHLERHFRESGRGEPHFAPYSRDYTDGPADPDLDALTRPLDQAQWRRWFVAETETGAIVGHVDLTGGRLSASRHRCKLGIGIERSYRGRGLGRRLMTAAIDFARGQRTLSWIDLHVFVGNEPALGLYRSLGFREVGTIIDRFRVDGEVIDDVVMTLNVE
jgi:RimJ/RimL family protein N-acetyltransferase